MARNARPAEYVLQVAAESGRGAGGADRAVARFERAGVGVVPCRRLPECDPVPTRRRPPCSRPLFLPAPHREPGVQRAQNFGVSR
jgi:hypothetical protein